MYNQAFLEKIVTYAETYWRDENKYQILKREFLQILDCFHFLSDENMLITEIRKHKSRGKNTLK